jgi:DNA-binding Xre family transcriptional regulator
MKGCIQMSSPKPPPKFVLTPEQRKIVEEVRRLAEIEKPEILAEGRRVFAADECVNGRLKAVMSILKAVRNSQKVTLDELAARTGMTKPYLSKLENDAEANVTINTLYRVADALGHDLLVSVIPRPQTAKIVSRKPRVRLTSQG